MRKHFLFAGTAIVMSVLFFASYTKPSSAAESVYGALYNVASLVSTSSAEQSITAGEGATTGNTESVLGYFPGEDGFIALTTNDVGIEWWTSDALGITWTMVDPSPLADLKCRQVGRHSMKSFNNEMYFGAACEDGASVFKITGIDSAERIYIHTSQESQEIIENPEDPDGNQGENPPKGDQPGDQPGNDEQLESQFPTASVLGDQLFMFFNGGYTVCETDGTCADVRDATGQPDGVPLEASNAFEGLVYLAFTSGEVMAFDGTSYTSIGDSFLGTSATNLPAIEVYNGSVYVGTDANGSDNGAALLKYDLSADDPSWELIAQLGTENHIINKMQVSGDVDGSQYLVFYTANTDEGSNIIAIDETDEQISLVDAGLGGENPENNSEVVSIINRTVMDGTVERQIMLFGTQNPTDQSKLFVLMLGEDFAINLDTTSIPTEEGTASISRWTATAKKVNLTKGQVLKVVIAKKDITKGDVYTLWINGKQVDEKTATQKTKIILKYKKARKWKASSTYTLQIGHQVSYGQGSDELLSSNIIMGDSMTVKIVKPKKKS